MNKLFGQAWVLFMILVIALGLVGAGYAVWSQQLQLEVVVATDSMDLDYTKICTDDDERINCQFAGDADVDDLQGVGKDPREGGRDPKNRYETDVGFCDAVIDMVSTNNKIQVHITDAFPSYWCTTWFTVRNSGSVPVKLDRVFINGVGVTGGTVGVPWDGVFIDADQDTTDPANPDNDIFIEVTDLVRCEQLDPFSFTDDEATDQLGDVEIHIEQGADEKETVSAELELIYVIWNESTANCPFPVP